MAHAESMRHRRTQTCRLQEVWEGSLEGVMQAAADSGPACNRPPPIVPARSVQLHLLPGNLTIAKVAA